MRPIIAFNVLICVLLKGFLWGCHQMMINYNDEKFI